MYQINGCNILVDMGASCKQITDRIESLNLDINDIDAILITHEHTDHVKGLEVFLKKWNKDVYITKKTFDNLKFSFLNYKFIEPWDNLDINGVEIEVLQTSHDSKQSVGFKFNNEIVHITDTGFISSRLIESIKDMKSYIIESNYEDEKIMTNTNYPFYTKQRIMSDKGHLSNLDCANYLKKIVTLNTMNIFFAHLSVQNNDPQLVYNHNLSLDVKKKYVLSPTEMSSHEL